MQKVIEFIFCLFQTTTEICPSLNIKEEFCEIIMGNMTPLIFPYLFPGIFTVHRVLLKKLQIIKCNDWDIKMNICVNLLS